MAGYLREGVCLMGLILNTLLGSDDAEGGGGAPGYSFGGAGGLVSQGDGNNPPGPYTAGAPGGTQAGDLLVCWAAAGPGYPGQSNVFLQSDQAPFPTWNGSPGGGGISIIDSIIGRVVLTITPRIATGDVFDNVRMLGIGPWPIALQMARFTNMHTPLSNITADNESSEIRPDASLFREDAPNNGFDHLLDVWGTVKKASPIVAGATVGVDPGQPTIVVLSAINYQDNGFGQGMAGVFGYRITPDGNPGVPAGNWFMSLLENNDGYAVSARWKSDDS